MNTSFQRTPLIALVAAAGMALSVPLFAQSQTQEEAEQAALQQQEQVDQQAASNDSSNAQAVGASTQAAEQASTGATQPQQGWNDVDTDRNGAISKQESSVNAGLSQIFDQADADADGALTQSEYKDFVSKNYGDAASQPRPQE